MDDDHHNVGTCIAPVDTADGSLMLAAALYPRARAAVMKRRTAARPLQRGYWVVDALGSSLLGFVPEREDHYVVLGRHTEAQIRVGEEHSRVSLRQALLKVHNQASALTLTLMDLESANGIMLHDGRRVRALDATGPFAAVLGGRLMYFLPETRDTPLPETLPVPELHGVAERGATSSPERGHGLARAVEPRRVTAALSPDHSRSVIQARMGSEHVQEGSFIAVQEQAHSHIEVDLAAARETAASAFRVSLDERCMGTLVLTAEQLRAGVLLGRYDRCWNLGSEPLPSSLSRVHAMLRFEGAQLMVTDLASSNGTTLDDEPVRSACWEQGQALVLGGDLTLRQLFVSRPSEA